MSKLRGVARKASKETMAVSPPPTDHHDDEAVRLVLVGWMDQTVSRHAKRSAEIHAQMLEELERQQRIKDARAFRSSNHKQREARRNRLIERRRIVPSYVPPCIDLSRPVRIHGNKYGTGASYRMVDGQPRRIE